jgi:hypothetical protein
MTETQLKRLAKNYNANIIATIEAIEAGTYNPYGTDSAQPDETYDAFDFLGDCLEIYRDAETGNPAVLISFGGPTTRAVVSNGGDWLAVSTSWDERITDHVPAPAIAAALTDYVHELGDGVKEY